MFSNDVEIKDDETEKVFLEHLDELNYFNIKRLNVNSYRHFRNYYRAVTKSGEIVFIKFLKKASAVDIKEIKLEQIIHKSIGTPFFKVPYEFQDRCLIIPYIEDSKDLKFVVKNDSEDRVIAYIRASVAGYVELLDKLNSCELNCPQYSYYKMLDIYVERWIMYSLKPQYIIDICLYLVLFFLHIYQYFFCKIVKSRNYIMLGDLNPGNCLCLNNYKVKYIDFGNVVLSDPNIDMASFCVRLSHLARRNPIIVSRLYEEIDCFKKSQYYNETKFNYARNIFSMIEKFWS